jgi:TolA-binding protein
MNDSTNYSYLEASAKRKKRNQFISILIIVAVVLAVVVGWGMREYKKAQDAERIKNALNSQVEPAFPIEGETSSNQGAIVDSASMEVDDGPVSKSPEPTPVVEAPVAEAPKVEAPKPEAPKPEPVAIQPKPAPKVVAEKPVAEKPVAPKAEPKPVVKVETKVPIQPKPVEPKAAEVKPAEVKPVEPVVASPVVPVAPVVPAPAKAFAPEDLPMPTKVEPSEESRLAMAPAPKVEPAVEAAPSTGSEQFKTGIAAYKQADYVNAIRAFAALSKPTSRKRGEPERDEYVQGNFLRGVALLKMQHISEAASAFQNALEYEKYYPLANMNLGICYIELKQYAKAHKCFEAVIRDQNFIEPAMFDDVMQRTKYFWALAWTRLCKAAKDPDRENYYRQQAILRWKDYQVWFSKVDKYKSENQKAENYLKSLAVN